MARESSLNEYKDLLSGLCRRLEVKCARGDQRRLERLDEMSDDELMRKWLWVSSIVGALIFYLGLPFLLSLLAQFIPSLLMQLLWSVLKLGMGMVIVIFALAVYFTIKRSD
ncbi:MAG: hypothetical protein HY711_10525 [Candidatus Melainabacteria bacterium]|nr:hypothetical protein [Candidatus Melainabacteria bacterium]